jgi:hypothetical protein
MKGRGLGLRSRFAIHDAAGFAVGRVVPGKCAGTHRGSACCLSLQVSRGVGAAATSLQNPLSVNRAAELKSRTSWRQKNTRILSSPRRLCCSNVRSLQDSLRGKRGKPVNPRSRAEPWSCFVRFGYIYSRLACGDGTNICGPRNLSTTRIASRRGLWREPTELAVHSSEMNFHRAKDAPGMLSNRIMVNR